MKGIIVLAAALATSLATGFSIEWRLTEKT